MSISDMMVSIKLDSNQFNKGIQNSIALTQKFTKEINKASAALNNISNLSLSSIQKPPAQLKKENKQGKLDSTTTNNSVKPDKENPYQGVFGVVNALKSIATSLVLKQDIDRGALRSLGAASGKLLAATLALKGIASITTGNIKGYQNLSASGVENKEFTGTLAHLFAAKGSEKETETATGLLIRAREMQAGLKVGQMPLSPEIMHQLTGGTGQKALSKLKNAQTDKQRFEAIQQLIGTGKDRAAKTDLSRKLLGGDIGLINYFSANQQQKKASFQEAQIQQAKFPVYNQKGAEIAEDVHKFGEQTNIPAFIRALTNNPTQILSSTEKIIGDATSKDFNAGAPILSLVISKLIEAVKDNTDANKNKAKPPANSNITNNITVNGANKSNDTIANDVIKKIQEQLSI